MMFENSSNLVSKSGTAPTSARTRKSFLLSNPKHLSSRQTTTFTILIAGRRCQLNVVIPDEKVITCVRAHKPEMRHGGFLAHTHRWAVEFVTSAEVRDDHRCGLSTWVASPGDLRLLRHSPRYGHRSFMASTAWLSAPACPTARSAAVSHF